MSARFNTLYNALSVTAFYLINIWRRSLKEQVCAVVFRT